MVINKDTSRSISSLRGVSALCILVYHYYIHFCNNVVNIDLKYFDFGWLTFAVPLFFVLSSLFLYEKAIQFKNAKKLMIYRILRLVPVYLLCVIVSTAVRVVVIKEDISFLQFILNMFMLEDVFRVGKNDGVYWTMEYEMALLTIFSFCSVIVIKQKKKFIENSHYVCLLWLSIVTVMLFFLKLYHISSSTMELLCFTGGYAPCFVIGIVYHQMILNNKKSRLYSVEIIWSCAILILFRPVATAFIALFAFVVVYMALKEKINKMHFVNNRFFSFVGSISYPLYLCHNQLGRALISLSNTSIVVSVVLILLSFVISIIVAYYIGFVEKKIRSCVMDLPTYKNVFGSN